MIRKFHLLLLIVLLAASLPLTLSAQETTPEATAAPEAATTPETTPEPVPTDPYAIDCTVTLEIWQIQGRTDEAHCQGETVVIADVLITAIGSEGFFIQMPENRRDDVDGDLTSNGLYVYTDRFPGRWDIAVGDLINIRGRVEEFFDMTQLEIPAESRIEKLSSGNELPPAVELTQVDLTPLPDGTHPLERYEGMLVTVTDAFITAQTNQFNEFAVSLTGQRAFREAGLETDDFTEFAGMGLPEWDLNPEVVEVDPPAFGLSAITDVTVGSRATVTGGLGYAFLDYSIWPTEISIDYAETDFATIRPREEGEFIIATQNVLNLFDTVDDPNRDDNRGENYTPADEAEYQMRLVKMSEQVRIGLQAPDILAIQEIENTRVLADLILQVNADDPTLRYTGCLIEGNEGRGIDLAYMVRVDRVNVFNCFPIPGSSEVIIDFTIGYLFTRPPLVLEAELITGPDEGVPITLINLHNRSLSDAEIERVRTKRMMQAVHVAEYVQMRQTENPDINLVVLGDINAFQFSDGLVDVVGIIAGTTEPGMAATEPEGDIVAPNLYNHVYDLPEADRYSYIWNGSVQVLDHILTSAALRPLVTDAMFSRGNADAPREWASEAARGRARTSDHDGFAIYVNPTAGE